MRKRLSGWKKLSACVFERDTGARIHTLGLIKIGPMFFEAKSSGLLSNYTKHLRLTGYNNRRALMALAEDLQSPDPNPELNKQTGGGCE